MAGVLIREADVVKLEKMGVKDSKLLTKEKREEFFDKIKEMVLGFRIEILEPAAVDAALNDSISNLNWLEADTSAAIVNKLKPDKVILDCPSNNISAYRDYFMGKLNEELNGMEVVAEHKADLNYVVVGAASILAKVTRDREIEKLKNEFGELGSGYLSDERTQIFLRENFDKDGCEGIFRKTWKPYQKLVEIKGQKVLGNF
jgi:ribonuclease HII